MAITRITKGVIKPNENYDTHNIVSTGIVTSVGLDVNGNADVSGSLSVGGVLTYEDVTSIDSVGIITARSGLVSPYADIDDFVSVGSNIHLGNAGVITATSFVGSGAALTGIDATAIKDSGGNVKIQAQASGAIHSGVSTFQDIDVDGHTNLDNVSIAGVGTFASSIYVADSIIHQGDTDTKIDFDSNRIKLTVGNVLYSDIGLSAYNYFYRATNFVSTSSSPKPSTYIARFRDEEGDDMEVQFFNTNVKNSILTWNDTGNTTAAGNLVFKGIAGGSGLEHARFTGSGNFNLLRDLDVDGHTNLDNVSIAGITTMTGNLHVANNQPSIFLNDLDSENDYSVMNNNGNFTIRDNDRGVNAYELLANGTNRFNGLVNIVNGLNINTDLDVDGHTNLDNVNIAGVTTSTGNIYADNYFGNGGLTLNNNGNPSLNLTSTSTTGSSRINFGDPDSGSVGKIYYAHNGDYIHFNTAYNERLRIGSAGQIGIAGANYGTSGQALVSQGSGSSVAWQTITGTTINNNANNRVITGSGTANTLEGEANLSFNGTNVKIGSGTPAIAVGSGLEIDSGGAATVRLEDSGSTSSFEIQNTGGVIKQNMYNNQPWTVAYNNSEKLRIDSAGQVLPGADDAQNLGSSTKRWANIYAADMHYSNEGGENSVDGTWGSYTIQEGESDLYLLNNRNGKKYKFVLQEVS